MANNHLSPHDRFWRYMLAKPKVIQDFFERFLPANMKNVVDLSLAELKPDSFINDQLRLKITDLLYSVKFNRGPGYIYILIEHQSIPDKLMPFRILKYMVAIMDRYTFRQ